MKGFIIVFLIMVIVTGYIVWQKKELKKFMVSEYELVSDKIKKDLYIAVIADLHGFEYGENNKDMLAVLFEKKPDQILIVGDLIVSKFPETYEAAVALLTQLTKIAPVFYVFGNHESRVNSREMKFYPAFANYLREIKKMGVVLLNNAFIDLKPETGNIRLYGLEIGLSYYEKGQAIPMEPDYITSCIGTPQKNRFTLLLAHNPSYCRQYADWGADLILCGHNHGGLIQIPGLGSIISPQLTWFPSYNAGLYQIPHSHATAIVSRGLGTHTYHIRINNRAELVFIRLKQGL